MYHKNIDTTLQKKIRSKEFEDSVDQAVRSFMYDLDFMLLEEQYCSSGENFSCLQNDSVVMCITNR